MSDLSIPMGERCVAASLQIPKNAHGTVAFVHGSGVDRHDERNRYVAAKLHRAGFATLLPDLLEPREALDYQNAFDIELQTARLLETLRRLQGSLPLPAPLGYFATGVGAGVALLAAARRPVGVAAVVARSGRPDTALFWLRQVKAPTLLIVDEPDECNRCALERLTVDKDLVVVPSESHFFHEPAALDAVAQHALRWFSRYMVAKRCAEKTDGVSS